MLNVVIPSAARNLLENVARCFAWAQHDVQPFPLPLVFYAREHLIARPRRDFLWEADPSNLYEGTERSTARTGLASQPARRSGNATSSYSPAGTWSKRSASMLAIPCSASRQ